MARLLNPTPKVQWKRERELQEPEDGRSVEKCCSCCAHELTQLGLSAQDLHKMKPVKNSCMEGRGIPVTPPLTEELELADGSWGRQGLFSLDDDYWLVAHALVDDPMLMYTWAE